MAARFQSVLVNNPECFRVLPPNIALTFDPLGGVTESFTGYYFLNFVVTAGGGESIFEVVPKSDNPSTPEAAGYGANTGDGVLTGASCTTDAVLETWTILCTDATVAGSEVWSVTGSVTGLLGTTATTGVAYTAPSGVFSFSIEAGVTPFAVADSITVQIIQPCSYIKAKVDCRLAIEGLLLRSDTSTLGGMLFTTGDSGSFGGQTTKLFSSGHLTPIGVAYSTASSTVMLLAGQELAIQHIDSISTVDFLSLQVSSVFPE